MKWSPPLPHPYRTMWRNPRRAPACPEFPSTWRHPWVLGCCPTLSLALCLGLVVWVWRTSWKTGFSGDWFDAMPLALRSKCFFSRSFKQVLMFFISGGLLKQIPNFVPMSESYVHLFGQFLDDLSGPRFEKKTDDMFGRFFFVKGQHIPIKQRKRLT